MGGAPGTLPSARGIRESKPTPKGSFQKPSVTIFPSTKFK